MFGTPGKLFLLLAFKILFSLLKVYQLKIFLNLQKYGLENTNILTGNWPKFVYESTV
jgi:hypothetical protein